MTTRYANYGLEGPPEYRCKRYNFETKKMEVARGFNLFHPDVLKRLEGLFRDLGRYPIEGILFQDDLILKHNEDFSTEANKAFLKEFGYLPHPDLFYIDPYQIGLRKILRQRVYRSFLVLGKLEEPLVNECGPTTDDGRQEDRIPTYNLPINLYYEAVLNDFNGMAWFSQTLSEALRKGF